MGAFVDELVANGYSVTDVMNQALVFFRDALREMGPYAPLFQHEAQLRGCTIGCVAGQLSSEKVQEKYPDFAGTLKAKRK